MPLPCVSCRVRLPRSPFAEDEPTGNGYFQDVTPYAPGVEPPVLRCAALVSKVYRHSLRMLAAGMQRSQAGSPARSLEPRDPKLCSICLLWLADGFCALAMQRAHSSRRS
jgi:hypothetical protein